MEGKKILIAVAAVVAAFVVLVIFRRKASAAQAAGVYAGTPTPTTTITTLQAPRPGVPLGELPTVAAQSTLGYVSGLLPPVINQGVNAIIPQSTALPSTAGIPNPCGLDANQMANLAKIAPGPGRDAVAKDWCRVNAEKAAGTYQPTGMLAAIASAASKAVAQQNFQRSVGYYG